MDIRNDSLAKKKKRKIILVCLIVVFVLGALFGGGDNTQNQSQNPLTAATLQEANVLNGTGDVIGKRAYIEIKNDELTSVTQEQFKEFVDSVVKNSGYNYVTIIATDVSKGIFFPASSEQIATYGTVNADGMIDVTIGDIMIQNDGTYSYTER